MAGAASASCQQDEKDIKIGSRRGSAKNSDRIVHLLFSLLLNLVRMFSGCVGYPVNFILVSAKHKPMLAIQAAQRDGSCLNEFALTGFFPFPSAQTEQQKKV